MMTKSEPQCLVLSVHSLFDIRRSKIGGLYFSRRKLSKSQIYPRIGLTICFFPSFLFLLYFFAFWHNIYDLPMYLPYLLPNYLGLLGKSHQISDSILKCVDPLCFQ
uniref:Uncharacterized protein n=1 Tax=Cacopsylla melanoneura TaxID=428564 RepID=A0A8D8M778_9HEMI